VGNKNEQNWEAMLNVTNDGDEISNRSLVSGFVATSDRDEKTKYKYRLFLNEFGEWFGAPLLTAKTRDITAFLAYLTTDARAELDQAREHPRGWKGNLSASTRKGYLAAIRELWRYAARSEFVDRDPTFGVETPKIKHKPGVHLNRDQLRKFLDVRGRERDRVQAYLLVFTAARAGEIRALRWEDVDFVGQQITLHGKFGKTRCVPIHPELNAALYRWQRKQREAAKSNPLLAAALDDPETAYVLLTNSGKPLAASTIAKQVKWRAKRAGLKLHSATAPVGRENASRLTPHALRRSWATVMRNEFDTALEDIAEMLGHESVETTRKHYAFAASGKTRRVVEAFRL
jgi:integrase